MPMRMLSPTNVFQAASISRARKKYIRSGELADWASLKWKIERYSAFLIESGLPKSGTRLVEIGTREKGANGAQKAELAGMRAELAAKNAPLIEEVMGTAPALRPASAIARVFATLATMDLYYIAKDLMDGVWKNNVNDALETIAYGFIFTGAIYFAKWGLERAGRIKAKAREYFKSALGAAGPALVMATASLLEYFQKIGAYPGTYDPKDYWYYAAGAVASYILAKPLIHDIFEAITRKRIAGTKMNG